MDILVLGATGMLGHKIFQHLRDRFPHTYGAIRGSIDDSRLRHIGLFRSGNVIERFNATDGIALAKLLIEQQPKVIVNCAGIVKQKAESSDAIVSISTNSLLPHQLVEISKPWAARVIHFSSDCVFSGRSGNYTEDDISDAEDLYGKSKSLGETTAGNSLTLRTSMIGRELFGACSLLEWFMAQDHSRVRGYRRAIYSGTTSNQLAQLVGDLIESHPGLAGLYQVTGPPISKYDLLSLARDAYGLDIEISPDDTLSCDRSMCGEKFRTATGIVSPAWPQLFENLVRDTTPYKQWRVA
jgi:dTDP-4-dehydrorhamnose reductase